MKREEVGYDDIGVVVDRWLIYVFNFQIEPSTRERMDIAARAS